MKNSFWSAVPRVGGRIFLASLLFAAGGTAAGENPVADESAVEKERRGIIFETRAVDPEVFTRVEGAEKTLMVPVYEWDYGVRLFTAEQWKKNAFDNAEYRRNAEAVADVVLAKVKPEFIRDSRGIVLYALIRAEDPFLSSILLSDKFLALFKKSMGDSVRVVLVDRQVMYVFPDSGGKLDQFGTALAEQYQTTRQPLSLEVLQITSQGIKAIGSIGD